MSKKKWMFPLALTLAACQTLPMASPQLKPPVQPIHFSANNPDPSLSEYAYRSLQISAGQGRLNDFGTKGLVPGAARLVVTFTVGSIEYSLSYRFMNKLRALLAMTQYKSPAGSSNPAATGANFLGVVTPGFFARLKATATTSFTASSPDPAFGAAPGNPFAYTPSASETAFATLLEAQNSVEMPNYLQEDDSAAPEGSDSFDARLNNPNDVFYDYGTQSGQNTIAFFNAKTARASFFTKLSNYMRKDWNASSAAGFGQSDAYLDAYTGGSGSPVTGTYYSASAATTNGPSGSSNAAKNNILSTGVINYNETVSPPTGTLFKMNAVNTSNGTVPPTAEALTLAEKGILTSILAQAPVAKDVLLVAGNGNLVKGNIGIGFGMNDKLDNTPPADLDAFLGTSVSRWGVANVNGVFPNATNKLPADSAELNGAAAVLLAGLVTNQNNTEDLINDDLGTAYGAPTAFDASDAPMGDVLRAIRALHMQAGGATSTVVPAASLKYPNTSATAFLIPSASATPIIQTLVSSGCTTTGTSTCSSVEFTNAAFNIFDALKSVFGDGQVYKLGKIPGTNNKNLEAIKRFFHANDPSNAGYVYRADESAEDERIRQRALVVPVNRTINTTTGVPSYSFSATGTEFVLILAQASGSGDENLNFWLVDPNFAPGEGYPALNISVSNPSLVTSLYNYSGTLVGVNGDGFTFANPVSEFRVNSYTTNYQTSPTMAMDSDGDFIIAWSGSGTGDDGGNFAQRYNAAGVAQGAEFRVNSYTTNAQFNPSVAVDSDGDFVIAWTSYDQEGAGSKNGIYAQRYNAAGVAQGAEFQVNSFTTSYQDQPSIAMDSDGDFVISWLSYQDGSGYGVYAQRYNAAGVAQGAEFQVNSYTTNEQRQPSIAMDSDGDFVISWQSYTQEGGGGVGIYAQRYNAAGVAQGAEFHVNSYTTSIQRVPAVAMDSDGDFVISWDSNQDGSSFGIYAQRYNAVGVAQGAEFQVNSYTTNYQLEPAVAIDSDGDFVISWHSYSQDESSDGIYAQRYNAAGVAQGAEFQVNSYTTSAQATAAVAMDSDGDFIVSWTSYQDGSGYGIYAQRYNAAGLAQ